MQSRNYSIIDILYEWVLKEQLKKLPESRDPRIIYVTDLVGCSHKYHLRKKYPELTLSFEPAAILGDIVHTGLGRLLAEKGFEVELEVSREIVVDGEQYLLKGRVDAFKRDEGLVVEVKTSRTAINLPRDHHVKQLRIYLQLLGAEKGLLIYITPDKLVEYPIEYQPVDIEEEVKAIINDTVHPRYQWECKYCVYRKLCSYYEEYRENYKEGER